MCSAESTHRLVAFLMQLIAISYKSLDYRLQIKDRSTVPLLLVGSTGSVSSLQELFSDHDYFAFDPQKVCSVNTFYNHLRVSEEKRCTFIMTCFL